jgi:Fur family ferric uptake transcriptional regulator
MSCDIILKQKGFKLTPQRRLILAYIHDNESHLTAEEILDFVGERAPGIDKSTVYRTLDLLENTGCVVKSEVDGHFIYHHAEEGHHHHLVCRSCGKSTDCSEDIVAEMKKSLMTKYGFKADLKHMMIIGLCSDCIKKTG